MSYQVLARKWRPRLFKDMVGQGHVLKVLVNALDADRLHHAYLFTGTRGVGKTTLARILAKCLNCEAGVSSEPCGQCSACIGIDEGRFVDLIEVDAASRAKVDETRELMDNVQYAPTVGRYKVYLIDEVHMFSKHSFNALLKTLEEPPPHVKFLLATTEPKRIPITILSRCLQFNLKHLGAEQIETQLLKILGEENIAAEPSCARLIAQSADGSMRDALSLLDQAVSFGAGRLEAAQVQDMLGAIDGEELWALLTDIVEQDAASMLTRINKMAELSPDYDALLAGLLSILHDTAVAQVLPESSDLVGEEGRRLARTLNKEDVQLYYQIALHGRRDLTLAPDPKAAFEMTLIRMLAFTPLDTANTPPQHDGGKPAGGGSAAAGSGAVTTAPAATPPQHDGRKPTGGGSAAAGPGAVTAAPADTRKDEVAAPTGASPAADSAPPAALGSNDDWRQLIDTMALTGLTRELALHCTFRERRGQRIHLNLNPEQEHILTSNQQDKLQSALSAHFGSDLTLALTTEAAAQETPAQVAAREALEKKQAALYAVENNPDVKLFMETFGATIDKDSISYSKAE
ncbi:MAG: DNA polymerase III subunit gamma/tau [Gammaproteobacteria bacterium]|nr:DNA polymerase III subunit gamma/tau [Gammaproteobacteria bacterium]MCY4211614.1 DNA polymerase III subunit gamma/tau [Gammaproteobacteria bacterium]MCY4338804.1 DNA polymerase III subunit gamma/tau [Gammaproteobacteria bacterium]